MVFFGIFISIFIFSIIVIIHELGHFSAARFFGVKVQEFGLGIPPKAKKLFTDKKGTEYTLNWLPLGGFVRLTGENPHTFYVFDSEKKLYNNKNLEADIVSGKEIFDKEGNQVGETQKQQILHALIENKADYNLSNKATWKQAIVILAGVVMNFILAGIIFSVLFFIGIKPIGINTKLDTDLPIKLIPNYEQAVSQGIIINNPGVILSPIEGSIAEKSGIQQGDIIYEIYTCEFKMNERGFCTDLNGNQLNYSEYNIYEINDFSDVSKTLKKYSGEQIQIYANANIVTKELQKELTNSKVGDFIGGTIYGLKVPKDGKIGSYISENISYNKDFEYKYGLIESVKYGFYETYNQSLLTFQGIGTLIRKIFNPQTPTERSEAVQQVSGPIGIVDFITNSLASGVKFMFIIAAIISINLGVFNLLPIPALDGGRFIFITVNGFIKKFFGRKAINAQLENFIHIGFFILLIALSVLIAYNDIIKIINN